MALAESNAVYIALPPLVSVSIQIALLSQEQPVRAEFMVKPATPEDGMTALAFPSIEQTDALT